MFKLEYFIFYSTNYLLINMIDFSFWRNVIVLCREDVLKMF